MENNGMEELRMLVTRLERLFDQQHPTNQDVNSRFERMAERWDAMAARWDGYIVEQRQFNQEMRQDNQEMRQMNARLQAILERLPPRGGANGGETAP
jgi:uncharacterized protein YukE